MQWLKKQPLTNAETLDQKFDDEQTNYLIATEL